MIQRLLQKQIEKRLKQQKVTVLLGARRVGKTELLATIKESVSKKILWLNGEDADVQHLLERRSVANYKRLLEGYELLIIDEAQYIPDHARKIKLMIDEIKPLHIIITGSSAFDLQQSGEPLTGRSITYHLYPFSQKEIAQQETQLHILQNLEERLLYGSYPEVITTEKIAEKELYLKELVQTYLLKDILVFENIRNSDKLNKLLILLAHQIGAQASLDELGKQIGISKNTVERYIDLLQKVFVIYKRSGYSNNLRKEVSKTHRYYFYDNGIRNTLINNFSPLALRQDIGALWENYFLAERIKKHAYEEQSVKSFFWRTYDQQEIDLIEEQKGKIAAYEMKWKENKVKTPIAFSKAYPKAKFTVVNKENYLDFL